MDPLHPILPTTPRIPTVTSIPRVARRAGGQERPPQDRHPDDHGDAGPPRDAQGRLIREWRDDEDDDPAPTVDVSA